MAKQVSEPQLSLRGAVTRCALEMGLGMLSKAAIEDQLEDRVFDQC